MTSNEQEEYVNFEDIEEKPTNQQEIVKSG